jgi:hypothetical protein
MPLDQTAPVIIVSADSHVGPRLREDEEMDNFTLAPGR